MNDELFKSLINAGMTRLSCLKCKKPLEAFFPSEASEDEIPMAFRVCEDCGGTVKLAEAPS